MDPTTTDYNKDGFIDTVAIEKEVVCTRKDTSKPFNRSGGDCQERLNYISLKT